MAIFNSYVSLSEGNSEVRASNGIPWNPRLLVPVDSSTSPC